MFYKERELFEFRDLDLVKVEIGVSEYDEMITNWIEAK